MRRGSRACWVTAGTMSPVSPRCCSTRAPRSTSPASLTRTPTGSHGHARWCAPGRVAKRWNACAARLVPPDDAHDDALHGDVALVETQRGHGGIRRLEPANPAMTPLRLNERDVTVQGVVVGVIRRY